MIEQVCIENIAVTLHYKPVKGLRLKVCRRTGQASCSVPLSTPPQVVQQFLTQRAAWLKAHVHNSDTRRTLPAPTPADAAALYARALPLVKKWAATMALPMPQLDCKYTISRWGCCMPRKQRIQLSTALLHVPPQCLEYVIVHELAHFYEANHSARFKALLDKYYSNWRDCVALLRQVRMR